MSRDMVFSIDQNCHTLWDPIPKIQALISGGYRVRHFIEDTDVAFTSLGAQNGDVGWHLARERFHHSGGTDWGAALFYSEFLGRLPLEIRDLEPFTGIKTRILAKKLGRTVEQLYEEFSPGQTWQLIGGSYVGDKEHHRLIGDISVADSKDFLCELLEKAYQNMLYTFPEDSSQMRLHEWFKNERKLLKKLLKEHAKGRLIDLYRTWMYSYLPGEVHLDTASSLFTCQLNRQPLEILEIFLSNYELASQLYNQSIQETNLRFRPLLKQEGELPFFAVFKHRGHAVRSPVFLQKGKVIIDNKPFELVEDRGIPLIAMRQAGIQALVGKAIILIIQIRFGNRGNSLALPYRGSLYMPAVEWLIKEMAQNNLLLEKIHPVIRVRLYLLERLKSLNTVIRLPDYLTSYFGKEEISARELGKSYVSLSKEATERLKKFKSAQFRRQWQKENFPHICTSIEEIEQLRLRLLQQGSSKERIRALKYRQNEFESHLLDLTFRQIVRDYHLQHIDYWDSRGAIIPWSIALGGENFYRELIAGAEIYEEPAPRIHATAKSP